MTLLEQAYYFFLVAAGVLLFAIAALPLTVVIEVWLDRGKM
jgi:hypothetical protein